MSLVGFSLVTLPRGQKLPPFEKHHLLFSLNSSWTYTCLHWDLWPREGHAVLLCKSIQYGFTHVSLRKTARPRTMWLRRPHCPHLLLIVYFPPHFVYRRETLSVLIFSKWICCFERMLYLEFSGPLTKPPCRKWTEWPNYALRWDESLVCSSFYPATPAPGYFCWRTFSWEQ